MRAIEDSNIGYSPKLWDKMAEMEWLGFTFPVNEGGQGGSLIDQLVLSEEMGRCLLPSPFLISSVICGQLILKSEHSRLRSRVLKDLIRGKIILSLALTGTSYTSNVPTTQIKAIKGKDGYNLSGHKSFVHYAATADYLLCPAKIDDTNKSILVLIDTTNPNLSINPLKSISNFPQANVAFNDLKVFEADVLVSGNTTEDILKQTLDLSTIIQCAEMVGRSSKILEMVVLMN